MTSRNILLEVKDLCTYFPITKGILKRKTGDLKAVDSVSFSIENGETFGLVGESGCGKSTLGRSILHLITPTSGEVLFSGEDISRLEAKQLREYRRKMQIVFQDPYASLNPRMTIGDILREPLKIHERELEGRSLENRVFEMLDMVSMESGVLDRYPHEFSGGQRQRICIARALILHPEFVVCDEPVSALDVSVRSQILNLMNELQRKLNLTYLFISHDLSVVKYISTHVAVMYLGRIVELASKEQLYENPLHPYTKVLLSAIPIPDPKAVVQPILLQGDVPSPHNPPTGCRFRTRCSLATAACAQPENNPQLIEVEEGHFVACLNYMDGKNK